jgi:hypothetical protein
MLVHHVSAGLSSLAHAHVLDLFLTVGERDRN